MATYYIWRKSTVNYQENTAYVTSPYEFYGATGVYSFGTSPQMGQSTGTYTGGSRVGGVSEGSYLTIGNLYYYGFSNPTTRVFKVSSGGNVYGKNNDGDGNLQFSASTATEKYSSSKAGTFQEYVYSTNSSAYPNGGVSGSYYYDQRTTVESPTIPGWIQYPNPITGTTAQISWAPSTNQASYPIQTYEISRSIDNGGSWVVVGTTSNTSMIATIPIGASVIRFRVRAKDTNNQWGGYYTGTDSQVLLSPTLTVPQMVIQGQSATVSWSEVEEADSYTLQRKSSADADWTQVYSGANLSYTETVGTWTSLQYRVQAVFDETPGGWATSDSIQIVAASALVISGTDGDLGALTSDVQYSVSSDQTGNTISVSVEVNGGEYAEFTATSGQTYSVGVLDLPTGTGNITITATTTVSESPVTVTRSWTYTKTAQTFPSAGSIGRLTQEGAVVWPETIAEAVRAGTPWGGNLSTALGMLQKAALYNRTQQPKYNEVTIDLSTLTQTDAQNGKIINLPYNGVMIPHRVVHIGNPDPELYDASCDGVWLLRDGMLEEGQWKGNPTSGDVPLSNSNIISNMEEDADNYDISVKNQIKQVKIPWSTLTTLYTQSNGLSVKLFPLSSIEVGAGTSHPGLVDSATLDYFSENSQENRSINLYYWLRTPYILDSANVLNVCLITPTGVMGNTAVNYTHYYRPCLILPTTFTATYYVDQGGGIHDQQEYTPAGDWLDIWGNTIPAVRIETGSYVGTGTYGESNPNTLTFPFEPKILIVSKARNISSGNIAGFASGYNAFGWENGFMWIDGEKHVPTSISSASQGTYIVVTQSENTISWYAYTMGAAYQANSSNIVYTYVALG